MFCTKDRTVLFVYVHQKAEMHSFPATVLEEYCTKSVSRLREKTSLHGPVIEYNTFRQADYKVTVSRNFQQTFMWDCTSMILINFAKCWHFRGNIRDSQYSADF